MKIFSRRYGLLTNVIISEIYEILEFIMDAQIAIQFLLGPTKPEINRYSITSEILLKLGLLANQIKTLVNKKWSLVSEKYKKFIFHLHELHNHAVSGGLLTGNSQLESSFYFHCSYFSHLFFPII